MHPLTVLIVEDNTDVREMMAAQLERRLPDVHVVTAPDAKQGLDALEREPVDLILSDFQMPEMNGVDFLARAKREYPATRRILITGAPEKDLAGDAAKRAGIQRFFVKPLDMAAVARIVQKMLATRST